MLIARHNRVQGVSLIEMLIGLAVLGLLFMVGLPSIAGWLQNTQIRASAEAIQAGLQLARGEALKRNNPVRFQLVSTLTSACTLSSTGTNWVVSVSDPAGLCDLDPSETVAPQILQKRAGTEGSANAEVAANGTFVVFTGLGRVGTGSNLTQIDVTNPRGGTCVAGGGEMRCLRLQLTTGGEVRMCDPAVTAADDPRLC